MVGLSRPIPDGPRDSFVDTLYATLRRLVDDNDTTDVTAGAPNDSTSPAEALWGVRDVAAQVIGGSITLLRPTPTERARVLLSCIRECNRDNSSAGARRGHQALASALSMAFLQRRALLNSLVPSSCSMDWDGIPEARTDIPRA